MKFISKGKLCNEEAATMGMMRMMKKVMGKCKANKTIRKAKKYRKMRSSNRRRKRWKANNNKMK